MAFPPTHIEFGPFELDLARGELRRDGEPVELSAKPLSLLVHLAVHRDRVVSKQELFDELWPDVVVGEAAMSSALKDLRRALGDDGSQMRFIRTFRRRGYRFVADVTPSATTATIAATAPTGAATAATTPRTSDADRDVLASQVAERPQGMVLGGRSGDRSWYRPRRVDDRPPRASFAGRDEELDRLREALSTAESGRARVVVIEGEAGIGKTRLVEEFVANEGSYVDVAIGRARRDVTRPYLAFAEAISRWVSDRDVRLEELLGRESQTLTRLLHPTQVGERDDLRSRLVGERERSELFAGLAHAVIELARRQPAALVLEDLQWADVSTLDLLEHMALAVGEAGSQLPVPLLIVATVRPNVSAENDATIERILRDDHCTRLDLQGLEEPAIAEIMDSLGFENPPARWVSSVAALSAGNPLFAQELTRRLRESGEHSLRLPESLEAALKQRLAELSPDCREVLTVAALIGDEFGLLALSAACRRFEEETRKLIDRAAEAGIVSGSRRAFRFEQRSWSHLLKGELRPGRRRALHAKLADVLEDLYASAGGEHAIEIAQHLLAAQDPEDGERLHHYCRVAGEQSLGMYAWREAGRFFAAAAEARAEISEADRAGLHLRAGIAFNHDWDADACIRHYEQAAAGFRHQGDHVGVAWALMYMTRAKLTLASATYGDKIDVGELEGAVELLRDSDPALCGLLLELLSEVAWMSGGSARARKLAEEALVIGHNLENDEVSHHACMGLALAHVQALRVTEGLECWRSARRHARALNANWLGAPAATREVMALIHLGRHGEAEPALDDALATARRAHNLGELSFGCAQRAVLRAGRGDTDGALKAADESINMMSRSRYPWGGPYALIARMVAQVLRGEVEAARDGVRDLVRPGVVFDEPGPSMQMLATVGGLWIDATTRAPVDADLLGKLIQVMSSAGQDATILGTACALIDAALRVDRVDLAVPLEPLLVLAHDRGVRFSCGWVFSVDRMGAAIAHAKGDTERAQALIASAFEAIDAAGTLPERVQVELQHARMADVLDGDEDTAAECRRRATQTAEQLGLRQPIADCLGAADAGRPTP